MNLQSAVTNDLWLKNSAHANAMAQKLATGLAKLPGVEHCYPVDANEIFIQLPETIIAGLIADGFSFYRWEGEHSTIVRLVTAFDTLEESVDALIKAAYFHSTKVLGDRI